MGIAYDRVDSSYVINHSNVFKKPNEKLAEKIKSTWK